MIDQANENLASFENVFVLESNLVTAKLPRKIDIKFSNAVLLWILDHGRFFKTFFLKRFLITLNKANWFGH